jgi:hypothetical protein
VPNSQQAGAFARQAPAGMPNGSGRRAAGRRPAVEPGQDALYDAKVKVVSEYIGHHVKEEEGEIFPRFRKVAAQQDRQLGTRMAARQQALLADLAGSPQLG